MDFEKTSFSVDWFAPGDKYGPKRLSFPKSACMSIDDLVHVSDTALSFCFSPVDEAVSMPRIHSVVDSSLERACGWTDSAPPSPSVLSDYKPEPMCDQDPKTWDESSTDWRTLVSPGILSIADDCASCGVDLDVSCLDTVDEQLLLSPVDCFTELCWEAAVLDDVTAPVVRTNTRLRARSFSKGDRERAFCPNSPPLVRDYPGSFERARPLATKISLPLDTCPCFPPSPLSSKSHDTSLTYPEKPFAYVLYADAQGRPDAFPTQDLEMPRPVRKREWTLTPSADAFAPSRQAPTPRLKTSKSSHTLRVISDVCSPMRRKKSPRAAP